MTHIKKVVIYLSLIGLSAFASVTVFAHHGVTAHFDLSQALVLEGHVVKLELRNPHSTIHLDILNSAGESERWHCEMHGSTILSRLQVTKEMLNVGTPIRIEGFQHRRNAHGCYFDVGILEDGRRIELGFLTGKQVAKPKDDDNRGTIFGTWIRKDFEVSQTVRRNFDVPLTDAGLAAHAAYDPIQDDPTLGCSPVSQIRVWGMATQPTEITQVEGGDILIRHEWMDVRRPVDLPPYEQALKAPTILGHSQAEWQEAELVVTTTGFTAGVLTQFVENFAGMASTGVLHSENLILTEILAIDPETDELVVSWMANDQDYFTEAFSGTRRLVRSNLDIQTYNCEPDRQ